MSFLFKLFRGTKPAQMPLVPGSTATDWISDDDLKLGVDQLVRPHLSKELPPMILDASVALLLGQLGQEYTSSGMANRVKFSVEVFATHGARVLLIPVNLNNTHWVLLRVSLNSLAGETSWKADVFDSLPGSGSSSSTSVSTNAFLQAVLCGLSLVLEKDSTVVTPWKDVDGRAKRSNFLVRKVPMTLTQDNGFDCGVFVFEHIRHLAGVKQLSQTQDEIFQTRCELLSLRTQVSAPAASQHSGSHPSASKVYVSFASKDGGEFAALADAGLKKQGVETFCDLAPRPAEAATADLKLQLDASAVFLCVLTPGYLEDPRTLWELTYLHLRNQQQSGVRFVPVLVGLRREEVLPRFEQAAKDARYLEDHTLAHVQAALNRVCSARDIHAVAGHHLAQQVLLSVVLEVTHSLGAQGKARQGEATSSVLKIPDRPFWGHPNMKVVGQRLSHGKRGNRLAFVGMSGTGKSTVASMICHLVLRAASPPETPTTAPADQSGGLHPGLDFPGGVCWLDFGSTGEKSDSTGLLQGYRLHHFLDGRDEGLMAAAKLQGEALAASLATASKNRRMLLVLDDVRSAEQLAPFSKLPDDVTIILTTQNEGALAGTDFTSLVRFSCDPAVYGEAEAEWAAQYLQAVCGDVAGISQSEWSQTAASLGNLPVLMSLVGSICRLDAQPGGAAAFLMALRTGREGRSVDYEAALAIGSQMFGRLVRDNEGLLSLGQGGELASAFSAILLAFAAFPASCRIPYDVYMPVMLARGFSKTQVTNCLEMASKGSVVEFSPTGDAWMHAVVVGFIRGPLVEAGGWTQNLEEHKKALRGTLANPPPSLSFADMMRMRDYLKDLGVADAELMALDPTYNPQEFQQALRAAAAEVFEAVAKKGDATQTLAALPMALSALMGPNQVSVKDDGVTPGPLKDLFQAVMEDPIDDHKFTAALKACSKEHFALTAGRPRFALYIKTLWADNCAEGLGVTHLVCLRGTVNMLRALLDAGATVPSIAEGHATQRTELFIAASLGKVDMVRFLLDRGVKTDHVSSCGTQYGAQWGLTDAALSDPTVLGLQRAAPSTPKLETLMSLSGRGSWCYLYAIHVAIIENHIEVVKLLLDRKLASEGHASIGFGWIDLAIAHKRDAVLQLLLRVLVVASPTTTQLHVQAARFLKRELPADTLEWYQRAQRDSPEMKALADSFSRVMEARKLQLAKAEGALLQQGGFEISIRSLTGKTFKVIVHADETVKDLKGKVQDLQGTPPDQQRLIFGGKQLENERKLRDYGVTEGSLLNLVLRMIGGR